MPGVSFDEAPTTFDDVVARNLDLSTPMNVGCACASPPGTRSVSRGAHGVDE